MNITKNKEKDPNSFTRIMYIIEAAVEYFIAIMVSDAYLAKICKSIGMADSTIGVLSAFVSLGCGMQIAAVFLNSNINVKRMVCTGTLVTNLCFVIVYLTPFFSVKSGTKSLILIVLFLLAYAIKNIVHSPKITWFMSFVDDDKRGVFIANKEIVSLFGGIVFTFIMGVTIDAFEAAGNLSGAFFVSALTVFLLGVFHLLSMILSRSVPHGEEIAPKKEKYSLKSVIRDNTVMKIVIFVIIWNLVNFSTTPFYGTYKVVDLGFSMTFNSVITVVHSLIRAAASRPMGRYGDKRSFASMMILCFALLSASLFVNIFTVPSNGYIMFTVYYMILAVAYSGINSGLVNLLYDYVPRDRRTSAFAFQNTVSGIIGFVTTWLVSFVVEHIQSNGNTFFGFNVYAQQVVSVIGFLFSVIGLLYLVFVVKRIPRK